MTATPLRWGIIGPGTIAAAFADALAHSATGELVAVGTRDPRRPGLAERFAGARLVDGYQALLDDDGIDAVYIATPHPSHAQWAIRAAEAGKHVLVEKPIALTAYEAETIIDVAARCGTFLGEAYMYRLHPQTARLIELLASGVIGEVRMVKSSFGFAMPGVDPGHRLYANDLAGGGILDVGGYPVSMARLIAGTIIGAPFANPVSVAGVAHLGVTGVDEWASAVMRFDGGLIAEVSCSVSLQQDNVLRILGTAGRIQVADFWAAGGQRGGTGTIEIIAADGSSESVQVTEPGYLYGFEADAVANAVAAGKQQFDPPGMTWADTIGNMRAVDQWRQTAGVQFAIETHTGRTSTVRGTPLGRRGSRIPQRAVAGLDLPVSGVALGFMGFTDFTSASIILDAFWEHGGNLFDTAWVYDMGAIEQRLGEWMTNRGVRAESAVIVKGAHTPFCQPELIGPQLTESLDRLQTDHADIYLMHRDNPLVPVGEFVEAMDAEVRAGRIRGPFGGSNWTMQRMDAAIAYARAHGLAEPQILSNNFALAELIEPMWPGCVSSSTAEWRQWLVDRRMTNVAWSSQGRGFFTERAGPDKLDDPELVRSWYSAANFARRDRAAHLAAQLGVGSIHVALAYVLAQPFTSLPVIGPRTVAELTDSLRAFDVRLTAAQLRWLADGEPLPE